MGLDNKRIVFEKDENGREEPESVDVEGENSLSIYSNSNLQSTDPNNFYSLNNSFKWKV